MLRWSGGEICFSAFPLSGMFMRTHNILLQRNYLMIQHVHYITAMWQSTPEAATVPDCSHSLYISSLPGSLSEWAKYGGSSDISALRGLLPTAVLCSMVHVHMPSHLTLGHRRYIADVIAWCRSQLLILKTYEISAFHGLLGTLKVIKNTQLTAGSLGSHGRTGSTPWLWPICCWMLRKRLIYHVPANRHGGQPTRR